MSKDILETFIDSQGWSEATVIELLTRYIDTQNSSDAFRDFLQQIADAESGR